MALSEEGPHMLDSRDRRPDSGSGAGEHDDGAAEGGGRRQHEAAGDGVWCFAVERRGVRLSSWALVSIFIYVNLLNYVDRGLVNGMLPEYCVNCLTKTDAPGCRGAVSCEWHAGNGTGNGTCAFNASVTPRLGIGGSLHIKVCEHPPSGEFQHPAYVSSIGGCVGLPSSLHQ